MGHFTAKNTGKDTVPFRDDAGKHFIGGGETLIMAGVQHQAAAEAAGLEVEWVQDPTAPEPVAAEPTEPEESEEKQPKRQAKVTVREE